MRTWYMAKKVYAGKTHAFQGLVNVILWPLKYNEMSVHKYNSIKVSNLEITKLITHQWLTFKNYLTE